MHTKKEGAASIGAMVLAFLASQHHNLHMALLTLGLGGSGMTFMQIYPGIRRGMLLLSLGTVVVNWRSLRQGRTTGVMRAAIASFSVLTLGLILWSLIRFGL